MSSLFHRFFNNKQLANYQDNRAIVFIDANFFDCNTLIQRVAPEIRVFVINPQADSIKEITLILHSSSCREVYIISSGSPGCLRFSNSELSINTLIQYDLELQSWFGHSFAPNNDPPRIYLHGCNVASGDVGDEFITKLERMTGAKVAASASVTNCHAIT